MVNHYAVLIGINAYPSKPLKGCVRDVQIFKNYLETIIRPENIQLFTASEDVDPATGPMEDPADLPTYDNVILAFENVLSLAVHGDVVYIHYSGHGTRAEPSSQFSNMSSGDLALVLLDEGKENQVRYLWGSRLAHSLNAMVQKGLVITVVLDCCFSAAVYRRDEPTMRFLPYDNTVGLKGHEYIHESFGHEDNGNGTRDASMLLNWLMKPDGYTIIVACGPYDMSGEIMLDNGHVHGALSYFLFQALSEYGGINKRHGVVYHHLCARFRKSNLQQHPVLYGHKDRGFLGQLGLGIDATTAVVVSPERVIHLQAGKAHGICSGDQFSLQPLGAARSPGSSKAGVIATAVQVNGLTSTLELEDISSTSVQTGWVASPVTRLGLQKFPIRVESDVAHRQEWLNAMKDRSLRPHNDECDEAFFFWVARSNLNANDILDRLSQKVINLPFSHCDVTINDKCDSLLHLARYELVKGIRNETLDSHFWESFEVRIVKGGTVFQPDRFLEVEHSDKVELIFENKGTTELCFYIYALGPLWQIQNILWASREIVQPQHIFKTKLKMEVPTEMRGRGINTCEDVIKIFITRQPTSFEVLELPKCGELRPVKGTTRTELSRNLSDDWAALNFPIRTTFGLN
ncbi:caspase [Pochonia chlamydosporia 170]|uniref:Caspase n=1 Tax=Pochonia chlamydosporia 170 TaxID=1380566 RepID=A0A179FGM4_METCM|nr:caspase [Pochonia chlamydosporia 170]OAQ64686.1 caspase [Pochonia chlamydosporia 170]